MEKNSMAMGTKRPAPADPQPTLRAAQRIALEANAARRLADQLYAAAARGDDTAPALRALGRSVRRLRRAYGELAYSGRG